jgi:hypothetical protein
VPAVAAVVSFRWGVRYGHSNTGFALSAGAFVYSHPYCLKAAIIEDGWNVWDYSRGRWKIAPTHPWFYQLIAPRIVRQPPDCYYLIYHLSIPLPPLIILLAAATAFLWYRDRPTPRSHCRQCGYDLTGNESGVCPECGTRIHEVVA